MNLAVYYVSEVIFLAEYSGSLDGMNAYTSSPCSCLIVAVHGSIFPEAHISSYDRSDCSCSYLN